MLVGPSDRFRLKSIEGGQNRREGEVGPPHQ